MDVRVDSMWVLIAVLYFSMLSSCGIETKLGHIAHALEKPPACQVKQ